MNKLARITSTLVALAALAAPSLAAAEEPSAPEATRTEVRKSLDAAVSMLDAAVVQAAKKGVISNGEAKEVRQIAHKLNKDLAAKLKLPKQEKSKQSKPKGKQNR
jgi:tellurite resistance protein